MSMIQFPCFTNFLQGQTLKLLVVLTCFKLTKILDYRQNPVEYQELRPNDLSALQSSNYNPNLPTKIYAPGM